MSEQHPAGSDSINRLLDAHEKASELIKGARTRRAEAMKQAKADATVEIARIESAHTSAFQERQQEAVGSIKAEQSALASETAARIADLSLLEESVDSAASIVFGLVVPKH